MAQDRRSLSDSDIIAQEERSYQAIFVMFASFLMLVAVSIFLILAGNAHIVAMWLVNSLEITLLLGWLLLIFIRVKPGIAPPDEAFGEEYLRKTVDLQHRKWRYAIGFTLLMLFVQASVLTNAMLARHNESFPAGLVSFMFAFVALMAVLTVSFGPGFFIPSYRRALNDELVRALQAKAVRLGYLFAVIEACAVLVAAAYKPQWTIAELPFAIAAAITLPGVYFLILEWRASRSG
jgi:hypothetical protein